MPMKTSLLQHLCFMIKSLAAKYCDVVAIIPVHGLSVDCLRTNCLKVYVADCHECWFFCGGLVL